MSIEAIKVSNRATSGYLVDIFPICKIYQFLLAECASKWYDSVKYMPSWMPGAKFKQQAIEWKQTIETYFSTPFGMVKRMKACISILPSTNEVDRKYTGCGRSPRILLFQAS